MAVRLPHAASGRSRCFCGAEIGVACEEQRVGPPQDRFCHSASEAKKMLEWGYRNFETKTLFAADQPLGYVRVFGGETRSVKVTSPEPGNSNGLPDPANKMTVRELAMLARQRAQWHATDRRRQWP